MPREVLASRERSESNLERCPARFWRFGSAPKAMARFLGARPNSSSYDDGERRRMGCRPREMPHAMEAWREQAPPRERPAHGVHLSHRRVPGMKPCDDPQFHAKPVFPSAPVPSCLGRWGSEHIFSFYREPKVVLHAHEEISGSPK